MHPPGGYCKENRTVVPFFCVDMNVITSGYLCVRTRHIGWTLGSLVQKRWYTAAARQQRALLCRLQLATVLCMW